MACRHGMQASGLQSCCRPLSSLIAAALESGADIHVMHDPTRGGLATTCHEVASRAGLRLELDEGAVPIREETRGICDLLGLDPYYLACEGRALFWVAEDDCDRLLSALQLHPQGRDAAMIGRALAHENGRAPVVIRTITGGTRPLDFLSGSDLPRIC